MSEVRKIKTLSICAMVKHSDLSPARTWKADLVPTEYDLGWKSFIYAYERG
jgi:hypothetical protein